MLVVRRPHALRAAIRRGQSGMVMLFALIILVLMSLGGLALIRSMDTSNLIAGNMAFQQAATHSADAGVESAIAWLETNNAVSGVLYTSIPAVGYSASTQTITASQTGETFWDQLKASGTCLLQLPSTGCSAPPGIADAAGNTVAYMIQRLCSGSGAPSGNGCAITPGTSASSTGSNEAAGEEIISGLGVSTAVYYRITVRVNGPRNTVSFVQAMVSM